MYLLSENTLSKLYKHGSGLKLSSFVLYVVGRTTNSAILLGIQVLNRSEDNIAVLLNYVVENGLKLYRMESKGKVLMHKYEFGCGKVYYAKHIKTGQSVAIKVIEKEKVQKVGMRDQTKTEILSMSLVKHPNILEVGTLREANGKLIEDIARKYFQQLISAVDFFHSRGVYHRDFKPENLLLDKNGTPKKGCDGAKSDIWSCGVILFVLLAALEAKNHKDNFPKLNAFDIIKLSSGLDLSGLFTETDDEKKKEVHYTSVHSASDIASKLKDTAQQLKFKIKKEDGELLKIEKSRRGRKGSLVIDAELFEVTPSFHLVEMKKCSGDSLEYKSTL
ncbi:Nuclear transport factor 2 (NTF2) family protein with RNA binding (RRM-RBD-RNP motifs) domain [Hibiscus syriacus]|uniref:non-specific serine/threonine protein kinase n=1 Tax=Hibiscus syriacus TaxID=106335 RepID=A0A6A2X0Z8_HIBSY|nr:Nuclear transport factor 2 (NTF2) family protein with RNA binding (RRM-RBD-RNP motifs) domain [Hibiscus syriacus]